MRGRQHLHQAARAGDADRMAIETRLDGDDREQQRGRESVAVRFGLYRAGDRACVGIRDMKAGTQRGHDRIECGGGRRSGRGDGGWG